jgi:hypothetical protein
MTEHLVVVAFDVEAESREAAHQAVVDALSFEDADKPGHVAQLVIRQTLQEAGVESWWLPEPDVKHVDGNDNAAMYLVPFCDETPPQNYPPAEILEKLYKQARRVGHSDNPFKQRAAQLKQAREAINAYYLRTLLEMLEPLRGERAYDSVNGHIMHLRLEAHRRLRQTELLR